MCYREHWESPGTPRDVREVFIGVTQLQLGNSEGSQTEQAQWSLSTSFDFVILGSVLQHL